MVGASEKRVRSQKGHLNSCNYRADQNISQVNNGSIIDYLINMEGKRRKEIGKSCKVNKKLYIFLNHHLF